jgi:hypothetical protein
MKSDKHGCAVIKPGQEKYEVFFIGLSSYMQYDYRSFTNRQLFTGIYRDIETARAERTEWLKKMGVEQ